MITNAYDPYISNSLLAMTKQSPFSHESNNLIKVAEHFKIDALFGILLPYTRIFISYNQYSGMLRHLNGGT